MKLELRGITKRFPGVVANDNVNLALNTGEVLSLIGENGAGKSTLMRSISGILPPTTGRIELYGSVSTLLALGVGFSQEMTGRDNVILGGLAAGLSRAEIDNKFDEIIDFARRLVYDNGVAVFNFGKHKGKSVIEVLKNEPQYYDWMMKGDFPLHTKQKLTEILNKSILNK